jgi:hypothetical protein
VRRCLILCSFSCLGTLSVRAPTPNCERGHPKGFGRAQTGGKRLSQTTLLGMLQMYEGVIRQLEVLRDPGVTGLLHRMELHRAEVIAALAVQNAP